MEAMAKTMSIAEELVPAQEKFHFRGARAWKLSAGIWRHSQSTHQGCVIGIHGYTEHSGRYGHFAKFLNGHGYDFVMMDLPGHGLSEGRKANIDRFDDYVESVEAFYRAVRLKSFRGPFYLFAHSLGGLIAIRFLQSSPYAKEIEKVFLSSPLLGLSSHAFHGVGRFTQNEVGLEALLRVTSLLPNLTLSNEQDLGGAILTHDQEMMASRESDPLVQPQVTISWTREFLKARKLAFRDADKIKLPFAIFQAGEDLIVSADQAERFIQKVKAKEKRFQVYGDLYHEILNESSRAKVMTDMLGWLQSE